MKRMRVIVGMAVLSLAAAACGGAGGGAAKSGGAPPASQAGASQVKAGQAGAEAATVNVALKDFSINPSVASLQAGKVTFQATNQGPSEHEFVVLKTDRGPKGLPLKEGAVTEDANGIKNVGEVEDLGAGTIKSTTISLTPGRYLLVCNLPGHYQAGMVTPFVVT